MKRLLYTVIFATFLFAITLVSLSAQIDFTDQVNNLTTSTITTLKTTTNSSITSAISVTDKVTSTSSQITSESTTSSAKSVNGITENFDIKIFPSCQSISDKSISYNINIVAKKNIDKMQLDLVLGQKEITGLKIDITDSSAWNKDRTTNVYTGYLNSFKKDQSRIFAFNISPRISNSYEVFIKLQNWENATTESQVMKFDINFDSNLEKLPQDECYKIELRNSTLWKNILFLVGGLVSIVIIYIIYRKFQYWYNQD